MQYQFEERGCVTFDILDLTCFCGNAGGDGGTGFGLSDAHGNYMDDLNALEPAPGLIAHREQEAYWICNSCGRLYEQIALEEKHDVKVVGRADMEDSRVIASREAFAAAFDSFLQREKNGLAVTTIREDEK